jgi:hypothetical protein
MHGVLTFSRTPNEPMAVYVRAEPGEVRSILQLLGVLKIDRDWPSLRDPAGLLANWLEEFGEHWQRTSPGAFLEGGIIEMGHNLVLADNLYDEGRAALLTVPHCKRLISSWAELLATRPHKSDALPDALPFEYLAHGDAANGQFSAAF